MGTRFSKSRFFIKWGRGMKDCILKIVLVSTPIGYLGSGSGGGVELTVASLMKGLLDLGHQVVLVAPDGSELPEGCSAGQIIRVNGVDQPSWQHVSPGSPVVIPLDGVLPRLWDKALEIGESADAVLNFSYDWLPIWLTNHVKADLYHLISMGVVSEVMKSLIEDLSEINPYRLAFHTYRQASDYQLADKPNIVGNGFDLSRYIFQPNPNGLLGWAGRIAPEKGLEDAVAVAASLKSKLIVWGIMEDSKYAEAIEASAPNGTIEWRGFLPTSELQEQIGQCRAFINTPKWNEAYGNVVIEAMACGVPVVAYDRGGPGELIDSGSTGWIVPADDVKAMTEAVNRVDQIDRKNCRKWVEGFASQEGFAKRVLNWIQSDFDS